MNREDGDGRALSIWAVYDHPTDYPHSFVARRFEIRAGGMVCVTPDMVASPSLDTVRAFLYDMDLIPMGRADGDDPVILESWF